MIIDTHCHLDHPGLAARLPEVLAEARRMGVEKFIVPGVGPEGWRGIAELAEREAGVFPAFGLHPLLACRYHEGLPEELERFSPTAVAIGEIGLDYAVSGASRECQIAALRGQVRLALRLGLPVLLHCRQAFQDLLRIVKEERVREVGGVMHGFSGSVEMAREFIKENLCVSLAGAITYRNAVKPLQVAAQIPLEYLVLETDAPDMTPEPCRGRENEPAFLRFIAEKLADIRGIPVEEVAAETAANAERLFRI
jgi:TatD DNase family protein